MEFYSLEHVHHVKLKYDRVQVIFMPYITVSFMMERLN